MPISGVLRNPPAWTCCPEPFSWHDAFATQGICFLAGLLTFAAGAFAAGPAVVAFAGGSAEISAWIFPVAGASLLCCFAALIFAARSSGYELPVLRALIAVAALAVAWLAARFVTVLPAAVPWGLAFGLVIRPPTRHAWIARAVVLAAAGVALQALAVVLLPLAVRAGDELAERLA